MKKQNCKILGNLFLIKIKINRTLIFILKRKQVFEHITCDFKLVWPFKSGCMLGNLGPELQCLLRVKGDLS